MFFANLKHLEESRALPHHDTLPHHIIICNGDGVANKYLSNLIIIFNGEVVANPP
jgi:hypothetical protein